MSIPLSVLDLAPVLEGGTVADSFARSRALAQHVERLGYRRFWLAEHHGMPGIASAATSLLIGHVAAATETIRVGAGGIMLPNHSPLVIAEQFGTLEALYPGRIDLGLGRAPGSDNATARALRLTREAVDAFPRDVAELLDIFDDTDADPKRVRAVPGEGARVPVWVLGSSLYGAQLAAHLGLPYAFASHFAPRLMTEAITVYRQRFRPSDRLAEPYVMLGANVFAADDPSEAKRLVTSLQQAVLQLRLGTPGQLKPPRDDLALSPREEAAIASFFECTFVGDGPTVRRELDAFAARTGADELIVCSQIFDHDARLRSYELVAPERDHEERAHPPRVGR